VSKRKSLLQGLPAALLVLSAAISIYGQNAGGKHNSRPQQVTPAPTANIAGNTDAVKYSYEFTQPKVYVKQNNQWVEFNPGRGSR